MSDVVGDQESRIKRAAARAKLERLSDQIASLCYCTDTIRRAQRALEGKWSWQPQLWAAAWFSAGFTLGWLW